jgi:glyoxylase-like metal-dependent hydrolase (beta-lactamase superfamily II)/rhodanese-related sulfurtransferase
MNIEQIYTGCLAQGAYYIESKGEVAIIDPLRETEPYVDRAIEKHHTIKYIFETHFHADFVSGHVDLAKKTGAKIIFGPGATTDYDMHEASDGEVFELGDIKIKVLHTPGHTPESSTFLLMDENGKEHSIFSGDTLFIGDVGRPDLAIKSDLTQDDLASMLYDSLREKIMPLHDEVIVYPAHGAGSACGKNMSSETTDTLGNQKKTNYALRADMSRDEFVKEVTEGLLPPPQYFAKNAAMNKAGYESIDVVMERGVIPLSVDRFEEIVNETGALILDTRLCEDFGKGFVPNSIFIGLDGQFASWVGTLIPDLDQPIVIVTDKGNEEETVLRLARVGYDNALGYLDGGFDAWSEAGKEIDVVLNTTAADVAKLVKEGNGKKPIILDVRKPTEYGSEHVIDAVNIPLNYINDYMERLDRTHEYHLQCVSGYRSMITASILKARGFENLINVIDGWEGFAETDIPKTEYVCPTTL